MQCLFLDYHPWSSLSTHFLKWIFSHWDLKAAIPSKADLGYQSTMASHICPLLYAWTTAGVGYPSCCGTTAQMFAFQSDIASAHTCNHVSVASQIKHRHLWLICKVLKFTFWLLLYALPSTLSGLATMSAQVLIIPSAHPYCFFCLEYSFHNCQNHVK